MYRNIAAVHSSNDAHIDTNTPLCRFIQKQHFGLSCVILRNITKDVDQAIDKQDVCKIYFGI